LEPRNTYPCGQKQVCGVSSACGYKRSTASLQGGGHYTIRSSSIEEAAEILEQNNANQVMANINIGHFTTTNQEEGIRRLQRAIAINTRIEIMHIHMCFGGRMTTSKSVVQIARGIAASTSIKRLF
jgi:sugar phosphate isomerase/epimerase